MIHKEIRRKKRVLMTAVLTAVIFTAISVRAAVNNENVCAVESNEWRNWPQCAADVQCGTAVLMDAGTGEILFDKGMDDQRYPASTTKIMTALLAIEHSTPETQVTFTETGMKDAYSGSSNILPQLGETFTMEQCIYMIMLKSANDVASQVAELVGGTVENFVGMMNQKAEELGCKNTHFNNANGLPDENHYTSAHDMALMAQAALKNETFRKVVSTLTYVVPPTNLSGAREYTNHHKMMFPGTNWSYDGCVGGKTGYTDASLSTLVTFAERDGLSLISVVMYGLGNDVIYNDSRQLLDYGFANFREGEDERIHTADGKILYEGQALTETEYEQAVATPTPIQEPKPSLGTTSIPEQSSSHNAIGQAGLGTYLAIGVLSALVLIGIIFIIAGMIHSRKKRK